MLFFGYYLGSGSFLPLEEQFFKTAANLVMNEGIALLPDLPAMGWAAPIRP
jgi:hypothetical protein